MEKSLSVLAEFEQVANSEFRWGVLTLNQEKSLNALTIDMIRSLSKHLSDWAIDPTVVGVLLQGSGEKAFCAGGDIRMLYESMKSAPKGTVLEGASSFFREEYALDFQIHSYQKPILCLGHGIVMGGGLGLMAGSSHRVLSEKSVVAMPEISIGLYPEVGASWFLNRMPGRVGLYVGLTGTRMKAADCLFVGLADHYIERDRHAQIRPTLGRTQWSDPANADENHRKLSRLLKTFRNPAATSEIFNHFGWIQEITDCETASEFWHAMEKYSGTDEWILAGRKLLISGSPTSAAVIFEQLKRSKHLSLKECFEMEYHMSNQFARRPDFLEGIRALLIDKDLKPAWNPSSIDAVQATAVVEHFAKS